MICAKNRTGSVMQGQLHVTSKPTARTCLSLGPQEASITRSLSVRCCGFMVFDFSPVADQLHPPNHLPNREKAEDLCTNHACCDHLLSTHVSHTAKEGLRRHSTCGVGGLIDQACRIPDCIDDRPCIFLECCKIPGQTKCELIQARAIDHIA